jgi:hypothetical protein
MRSIEGAGVQRKLEHHMEWAFGGILGMTGRISPTWSPAKLRMGLTFGIGKMFGAEKRLSSL